MARQELPSLRLGGMVVLRRSPERLLEGDLGTDELLTECVWRLGQLIRHLTLDPNRPYQPLTS
ncbi:MAG: hypothetical protein ACRDV9_11265 [Acidimicrobiia bacterium]